MYSSRSSLNAYRSVAAHSGVATADPHQLVVMLMDGALERLAAARGAIENGSVVEKASLIHKTISIIDELHASLNLQAGGDLAANLASLYEYCGRQLLRANAESRVDLLDEVHRLLREIRSAWIQIPALAR